MKKYDDFENMVKELNEVLSDSRHLAEGSDVHTTLTLNGKTYLLNTAGALRVHYIRNRWSKVEGDDMPWEKKVRLMEEGGTE